MKSPGPCLLLILILTNATLGQAGQAPVAASGLTGGRPSAIVLFINSYHRGHAWSDGIEEGTLDLIGSARIRRRMS